MLTSKQRAYLRGIASTYDTIFQIGKGGVTEVMCKDIGEALQTGADVVQVIGSRFVLFKRNEKEPVIENIPKAK